MSKSRIVFLNGRYMRPDGAKVSVFDRGLLYGQGLFETCRIYSGKPFLLGEHLRRLFNSAKELSIRIAYPRSAVFHATCATISRNRVVNGYVRITVTGGKGDFRLGRAGHGSTFIYVSDRLPYPPALYGRGAAAITCGTWYSKLNGISRYKTLCYFDRLLARQEALSKRAHEAIFLDRGGQVIGGAMSNIFIVERGRLLTPALDSKALVGITRQTVLRIAETEGMSCAEVSFGRRRLFGADEVFLTNSLMELLPVGEIDGRPTGAPCPGPVTRLLLGKYREVARKSCAGSRR